jgi:hypothetical protein
LTDRKGQWFKHLIDGDTVDTTEKLCERINEFFLSLTSDFVPRSVEDISNIPVENAEIPEESFVTTMETYNSLRSLKVRKAPGPDEIPNIVLKQFAFDPIPPKSPPNSIEKDIRPISLTCQIAKVMEGFTLTRILPTILPQLDNKQFAVSDKSTEQAIVYILHVAL